MDMSVFEHSKHILGAFVNRPEGVDDAVSQSLPQRAEPVVCKQLVQYRQTRPFLCHGVVQHGIEELTGPLLWGRNCQAVLDTMVLHEVNPLVVTQHAHLPPHTIDLSKLPTQWGSNDAANMSTGVQVEAALPAVHGKRNFYIHERAYTLAS